MSPAEATGVKERPATSTTLPGVTLHIRSIPGSQARHVIKVAVLPNAASPEAAIEMVVRAKGMSGSLAFPVEYSLDEPEAAALTAKTPRFGLQLTAAPRAFSPTSFITQRDASCRCCNPLTVG
jgi:hypothetical protein